MFLKVVFVSGTSCSIRNITSTDSSPIKWHASLIGVVTVYRLTCFNWTLLRWRKKGWISAKKLVQ